MGRPLDELEELDAERGSERVLRDGGMAGAVRNKKALARRFFRRTGAGRTSRASLASSLWQVT